MHIALACVIAMVVSNSGEDRFAAGAVRTACQSPKKGADGEQPLIPARGDRKDHAIDRRNVALYLLVAACGPPRLAQERRGWRIATRPSREHES